MNQIESGYHEFDEKTSEEFQTMLRGILKEKDISMLDAVFALQQAIMVICQKFNNYHPKGVVGVIEEIDDKNANIGVTLAFQIADMVFKKWIKPKQDENGTH